MAHPAQALLGFVDQRAELVQEKEAGGRVGKGGAQKDMVGSKEAHAVERAAGKVIGDLAAELGGQHRGVFFHGRKRGKRRHCSNGRGFLQVRAVFEASTSPGSSACAD